MTEPKKIIRYKENPFLNIKEIPIKDKKLTIMGANDNVVLNQHTGEIQGTQIATYRKVDADKFVKLFAQNIGLAFDLSSYGIKAFTVVMWAVQQEIKTDVIKLNQYTLDDFKKDTQITFNLANFRKGIKDLENAKILAKTLEKGYYFINPHFMFNGDRITYTQIIEKRKKSKMELLEEQGQTTIFDN